VKALAIVLALSSLASAAPTPEQRQAARDHYDRATAHYNLGEYAAAAGEFREAYKAVPEPVLLYDIAQAYRLADDKKQSLFFYQSYLRTEPPEAQKARVEKRIKELSGRAPPPAPPDMAVPPQAKPTPDMAVAATKETQATGGSERLKPIVETIKTNRARFRACYDDWGKKHKNTAVKISLVFTLDPDGWVDRAETDPEVEALSECLITSARMLGFPAAPNQKYTRVKYPFDFQPK
jgi:hypothetical protein